MKFRVTIDGRLVSTTGSIDDDARKALSVAMAELNTLGGRNAAIDLTTATGAITISCAIEAENPVDAVQPASDNIRLALGQGGIGTPDWPNALASNWTVEFINSRAEALVQ